MSIPFKNPDPSRRFVVATEKRALTRLFNTRGVLRSSPNRLLLASWNIANLGAHKRRDSALQIIAHILKRFDLIAVQELNDNFRNLKRVLEYAGRDYDYIMTDTAGNNERLAYVFRRSKVVPTNLEGELALRPRSYPKRTVRVRYTRGGREFVDAIPSKFTPFDRNPFIGSFRSGNVDFTLVNVHLYFGKFQNSRSRADREKYARRVLEIYALSRWSGAQLKKPTVYNRNIVLLGDMNVPAMDEKESTYKALVRFGWKPVDYVSQVGGPTWAMTSNTIRWCLLPVQWAAGSRAVGCSILTTRSGGSCGKISTISYRLRGPSGDLGSSSNTMYPTIGHCG